MLLEACGDNLKVTAHEGPDVALVDHRRTLGTANALLGVLEQLDA